MSSERVKYQTSGHTSNCACTRCRGVGPKNPPTQLLAEVAPSPPQPGDTVLVEAVVVYTFAGTEPDDYVEVQFPHHTHCDPTAYVPLSAIHPAPAKKGDHK